MRCLIKALERRSGQSLVEFILILPITIVLLMGVIDFGFVFYGHVQVAAAVGEGARVGSLFLGNLEVDEDDPDNDPARAVAVRAAVTAAMGRLNTAETANYIAASDVTVSYNPLTPSIGARRGDEVVVKVVYRQPVLFQFILGVSNSRISVSSTSRMRIQ